jgi:hypothetical protein
MFGFGFVLLLFGLRSSVDTCGKEMLRYDE